MPGMGELIVILLIVLVVFGASKLPQIGDALGRSIKNFKRSSKVDEDEPEALEDKDAKSDVKQIAAKQPAKQLDQGEDAEWEEVVVRRRKKASAD